MVKSLIINNFTNTRILILMKEILLLVLITQKIFVYVISYDKKTILPISMRCCLIKLALFNM